MIFLGDIACPYERVSDFIDAVSQIDAFRDELIVLNLEAEILNDDEKQKPLTLYNALTVLDAFKKSKGVLVSLANNHTYDYPDKIQRTIDILKSANVKCFGVNNGKQTDPLEIEVDGVKMAFFGHCWRLYTHTNNNNENDIRVNDSFYDDFVRDVKDYINKHPGNKVYCFMHWNYDGEKLVMPMHRKIAHDLIDAGVETVVGSHSHRPQGAELYKGKPVVYGLGNFYLPSGVYFEGKLTYPDFSKETYALRIDGDKSELIWFDTDKGTIPIKQSCKESFDGLKIRELSPFLEMDEHSYVSYFKKHRSKSFLVPVFDNYIGYKYKLKETMAIVRVRIIKTILKILKR